MNKHLFILTIFFTFALIIINACSESAENKHPKGTKENPIIMGFNPAEGAEQIYDNAEKLVAVISERSGYTIKTHVTSSYSALTTALKHKHIDIAWLSAFPYIQAEQYADTHVLLKAVREGNPYYFGAIVVKADSPFNTIEDLRGHKIAWASESSTSGRIFPEAALRVNGIEPHTFFSNTSLAGDHKKALITLLNGYVDAAAVFARDDQGIQGAWTQYLDESESVKIRPIFFTKPIPSDTMSVTKSYWDKYPEQVEKIVEVVKGLSENDESQRLMKELYNIDAMINATSADYDVVREAAILLDIPIDPPKTKPAETDNTNETPINEQTEEEDADDPEES